MHFINSTEKALHAVNSCWQFAVSVAVLMGDIHRDAHGYVNGPLMSFFQVTAKQLMLIELKSYPEAYALNSYVNFNLV